MLFFGKVNYIIMLFPVCWELSRCYALASLLAYTPCGWILTVGRSVCVCRAQMGTFLSTWRCIACVHSTNTLQCCARCRGIAIFHCFSHNMFITIYACGLVKQMYSWAIFDVWSNDNQSVVSVAGGGHSKLSCPVRSSIASGSLCTTASQESVTFTEL